MFTSPIARYAKVLNKKANRFSTFAFPETQRAIVIKQHGPSDVLCYEKKYPVNFRSQEDVLEEEVIVKHSFAGLNFIDTYYRSGLYKQPLPFIGGGEAVGEIVHAGDKAKESGAYVGMRVGMLNLGSYCEYSKVDFQKCIQIPEQISDVIALSAIIQGLTAHYLVEIAEDYWLKKNDWCVVHAGAGGTGSLLIQLLKTKGARIISTSSENKVELAKACGADVAVTYSELRGAVAEVTDGMGVKTVFDGVGANTASDSLSVCALRGLVVYFGNASGPVPPVDPLNLVPRSLFITRPKLGDYITTREDLQRRANDIFNLIKNGSLNIKTDQTFALKDAKMAHDYIESAKTTGKVIIKI